MKVLVTGGAGFIGSHLVEGLLERGDEVRVLDNLSTGKDENLRGLGSGRWDAGSDFEFVEGDIRDLDTVANAVSGVDFILHQAALGSVPRSVEDPITTQQVNANGTLNVFLAARDRNVSRVVYASSSAVYGDSEILPKKEGTEGSTLSPYALTKKANEEYGRLFKDLYGLQNIGLRYFNVYGPRQDPDSDYAAVIPRFVTALISDRPPIIYGSGEQSRDFTYVKDVVAANFQAMNAPEESCGQGYNVGMGGQFSLLELLDVLQDLLGTDIKPIHDPPRAGDVMHSRADASAAGEKLGFIAQYDLRAGLAASIDWYRRHFG
jgi:UDP-N-acetylglucosamine/UDP-N-acetyl-alpha-D-glucosaminouronate 4-epimerase